MTKTNPRSSEEPLGHRLAVRDIRFAGLVAVGLVGGVLAIGALASPMLGWSGSTASVLPEHEQTVRLAEPAAAARRAGVAPGPSEPQRRPARRERRRHEPRAAPRVEHRTEVGLQPAASAATPEPAGVEPKPATSRRTSLRPRRAVAVPDLRAPRWRLPSSPAASVPPPPSQVEGSPQPAEEPPAEAPPAEAPAPDRPPEAPLAAERPSSERPIP